jgi:hypothetical protein
MRPMKNLVIEAESRVPRCAAKAPWAPADGVTTFPPNAPRTIWGDLRRVSIQSKRGSVAAIWSSLLVLALVTVPDPPRLIATFVVVSRSRPAQTCSPISSAASY